MNSTSDFMEAEKFIFVAEKFAAQLPKIEEQDEEALTQPVKSPAQPKEVVPVNNHALKEQIIAVIDVWDFLNQIPKNQRVVENSVEP